MSTYRKTVAALLGAAISVLGALGADHLLTGPLAVAVPVILVVLNSVLVYYVPNDPPVE